jgi:signal transduction histidine kinase
VYQNTLEKQLLHHQAELEQRVLDRTRELQEARDQAEEAIKLKNTLLGNISNQIREPLLGLSGMVNMMKEESRENPVFQRYVHYMDDNITHVFSLLRRILELKE